MKNHTPTPWKLVLPKKKREGRETEEGGQVAVHMGDRIKSPGNFTVGNEIILDENCIPGENKVAKANARHIVHCVNIHDDLVEALKEARLALQAFTVDKKSYTNMDGNERVCITKTLPKIEQTLSNCKEK